MTLTSRCWRTRFVVKAMLGFTLLITSAPSLRLRFADAAAPQDASNFQGMYPCSETVRVGRPKTTADVVTL
eukprot:6799864-Pyramimonas_sp.AAC.1